MSFVSPKHLQDDNWSLKSKKHIYMSVTPHLESQTDICTVGACEAGFTWVSILLFLPKWKKKKTFLCLSSGCLSYWFFAPQTDDLSTLAISLENLRHFHSRVCISRIWSEPVYSLSNEKVHSSLYRLVVIFEM